MAFQLEDVVGLLRCPVTGEALQLQGERLVADGGRTYPIIDGIPDLTDPEDSHAAVRDGYDAAAGVKYNLWIFNPLTMAFTWGLGVLKMPVLLRPSDELGAGLNLEVPCGTGIFTARAYRDNPASSILAVDYSMGMLRAARQRCRKLGVDNAVFIRADVAHLPLTDGCVDGCLSLAGFHAFPDPRAAAGELGRVLKPGGRLATSIACSGERRISDLMIERVMKPGGYFSHGLSVDTYRSYLQEAGLGELRVAMAGAVMVARGRKTQSA